MAPRLIILVVGTTLFTTFPNGWIGRDASIPDLPVFNLFFLNYVKNMVYAENNLNLMHLCERVLRAITIVTPEMLQNYFCQVLSCMIPNQYHLNLVSPLYGNLELTLNLLRQLKLSR